jgi:hypothetical protein
MASRIDLHVSRINQIDAISKTSLSDMVDKVLGQRLALATAA